VANAQIVKLIHDREPKVRGNPSHGKLSAAFLSLSLQAIEVGSIEI